MSGMTSTYMYACVFDFCSCVCVCVCCALFWVFAQRVITISADKSVRCWDSATLRCIQVCVCVCIAEGGDGGRNSYIHMIRALAQVEPPKTKVRVRLALSFPPRGGFQLPLNNSIVTAVAMIAYNLLFLSFVERGIVAFMTHHLLSHRSIFRLFILFPPSYASHFVPYYLSLSSPIPAPSW